MSEQRKIEWDFTHFTIYDYKVILSIVQQYETIKYDYVNQSLMVYYLNLADKSFNLNDVESKEDLAYNYILPFLINLDFHFCKSEKDVIELVDKLFERNQEQYIPEKYKYFIEKRNVVNAPKIFEDFINSLED